MSWSQTTKAKSDQLNADDLIGGDITIKITKVTINLNDAQSGIIHYEGDNGKPYKPCKSMRRVIEYKWGADENYFVGRSLTLTRDATVKWAGQEVGGIRITHMSHIEAPDQFMLTYSKGVKRPYKIGVIQEQDKPQLHAITDADYFSWTKRMDEAQTETEIESVGKDISAVAGNYDEPSRAKLKAYYADRLATIKQEVNP